MKKYVLTIGVMLLALNWAFTQNFSLVSATPENITVGHQLSESDFVSLAADQVSIGSDTYHDFSKSHRIVSVQAGEPAIPFYTESVILPGQGQVSLVVTHSGYTEYNDVLIAPSKGNLKRNVLPSDIPYFFGETYGVDAFFPGELATLTEPFILRNTRGITVIVNPYQYNPVTKKLRVYKNIQTQIEIDATETGINELTLRPENSATFNQLYRDLYLNTNDAFGRYTPRDEEGEMLIISADSYLDEMEPFVEWKTQEGIKTTLVAKSDAGATDVAIKAYIADFYDANPDLVFVLLVGDHSDIPAHTYGTTGWEELWSDSYYGQMTGDYYPELFVGRFSGNSAHIQTMVARTLEYEKNPAAGDWMSRAIGLASNEGDGYGDDGEADWQHARTNRAKLLGYGYTEVHEFYDGSHGGADAAGNPSAAIINPKVNEGVGLFNYTGHGDEFTCVTGNYSSSDINSAVNNGKYPFVISVACNNGSFTSGTCISETWLRATNASTPSGAIAACGSTILMAWAEPMQTQDELSDIIAETYTLNRKATLGGIFYNSQMSMLEDYGGSSTAREVMQTWVMFGDPSTLFRNQETVDMIVSHVSSVSLGTSSVNVDCDAEDANVAIVQNNIILGTAKVLGGVAAVSFDPLVSDEPLTVTATKQNYKPYQGVITVDNGTSAAIEDLPTFAFSVYPNPASEMVTLNWGEYPTPDLIELHDLSGKLVYAVTPNTKNMTDIPLTNFEKGVYFLRLTTNGNEHTAKLIVQ